MKVIVKEKSVEKEYPWIGILSNGCIVLFSSQKTGIVLEKGNSAWDFGELEKFWVEEDFIPFTGEITLSNS